MDDALTLVWASLAGMLLGAMFFGGLWWTVKKGIASPRPAMWFLGSLFLRTAIVLAGFYLVAGSDWKRLTACLLGFVVARLVATRLTAGDVAHAPGK